jgi:hypothetical protein
LLCDIADQEGLPVPELSPEAQKVFVESLDNRRRRPAAN